MKKYKNCPFCGRNEIEEAILEVVEDGELIDLKTLRCQYCGIEFILYGEDFNRRVGDTRFEK